MLYHKATDTQTGTIYSCGGKEQDHDHDGVDGSHFGRDKTLSKVSTKKDSVREDCDETYCDLYCDYQKMGKNLWPFLWEVSQVVSPELPVHP